MHDPETLTLDQWDALTPDQQCKAAREAAAWLISACAVIGIGRAEIQRKLTLTSQVQRLFDRARRESKLAHPRMSWLAQMWLYRYEEPEYAWVRDALLVLFNRQYYLIGVRAVGE